MTLREKLLQFRQSKYFFPVTVILILVFLTPLALLLLSLFSTQRNNPQAQPINNIQTQGEITIMSVSPKNNSIDIGIFPEISSTFSKALTANEQGNITITTTPQVQGKKSWSTDEKTLIFTPTTPLQQSTDYTIHISGMGITSTWSFTTVATQNVSAQDQQKAQSQADKNFGDQWKKVDTLYPWYDSLPLQTDSYFVYFDLDTRSFVGKLYPSSNSSVSEDNQVIQMKQEIIKKLEELGIDTTKYKFTWTITPASE